MNITADGISEDLALIRSKAPLVHNITNFVVMNTTANALLAIGASPVMAHADDEAADMVGIAAALVINIGTLRKPWVDAMHTAASAAREKGIPIVLDPVGVGATAYRTETAKALIQTAAPTIIRGNASEIQALVDATAATKGVDATASSDAAVDAGKALQAAVGGVVCISGETDYIIDASGVGAIANGHAMMPRVTGLGCTASALCGAFAAVNDTAALAAAHAMAVMGIAGEMAAAGAPGPGTLQTRFIDILYGLQSDDIGRRLKAG
jgi:hydroxyethylthiazole kinase